MLKLHSPFRMCLSGASMTGKTEWVLRLIDNNKTMIDVPPIEIIYCYKDYQDKFNNYKTKVKFYKGLPSKIQIEKWTIDRKPRILILDDLLLDVCKSEDCVNLFCIHSHHRNLSCIFISQSIFPPGKYSVLINRQMTYLVLFKNLRDAKQISILGSQIFPGKKNILKDAYSKAMQETAYLFIDLNPLLTNEDLRLRTRIFPKEYPIIYVPQKML